MHTLRPSTQDFPATGNLKQKNSFHQVYYGSVQQVHRSFLKVALEKTTFLNQ